MESLITAELMPWMVVAYRLPLQSRSNCCLRNATPLNERSTRLYLWYLRTGSGHQCAAGLVQVED